MTKEIPVYVVYKCQVFGQQIDKIFLNEKEAEEYKNSFSACCQPYVKEETLIFNETDLFTLNTLFT